VIGKATSDNGGDAWRALSPALMATSNERLIELSVHGRSVLISGEKGLYLSRKGGQSFQVLKKSESMAVRSHRPALSSSTSKVSRPPVV
jgi:photosystem II stability/assembly factor-like uncharacterized protein